MHALFTQTFQKHQSQSETMISLRAFPLDRAAPLLCPKWTCPPRRGTLKNQLDSPPWAKFEKKKKVKAKANNKRGTQEVVVRALLLADGSFCCDAALALSLLPLRAVSTAITTAR